MADGRAVIGAFRTGLRDAWVLLRGGRPSVYPGERAMLWFVVVGQATGWVLIGYLEARNIIAGWPW